MDYVTSRAPAAQDDRNAWAEPGVEDLGGGLYRIPLPLPGDALTAVNVYAMTGDDGVDLIDAGMALVQARERLTAALGQLGYGLPDIRNFFITHIHQDHYTLAVELRTTLRGQITLGEASAATWPRSGMSPTGRSEVGFIEMLARDGRRRPGRPGARHDGPAPRRPAAEARVVRPRPLAARRRADRPARPDAARDPHPGHTTGHVVFHDEAAALLFAGDHVLPHITPSIGFQPAITRQALSQYLGSLRLMLTLPDTRLLPAHGPVQASTHARVHQLLEHHETRLAQTLEAAVAGPGHRLRRRRARCPGPAGSASSPSSTS